MELFVYVFVGAFLSVPVLAVIMMAELYLVRNKNKIKNYKKTDKE